MNYTDFKTMMIAKETNNVIQYEDQTTQYKLWFYDGIDKYSCFVEITDPANDDQLDFETNYKDNANKPIGPKAPDSTPYVRVTEKTVGKYLQLYGFEIECPKNETTNYDIKWTTDIEFTGAKAFDEKGIKGNYSNMQLIDKDNILGYGAGFILHEFGKKVPSYILNNGCDINTTTAATINQGLYIRIQYVNNSQEEDTTVFVALKYYL